MLDFTQFSLILNLAIFAVAAVMVWIAGTRLAWYADAISTKTGIGQAAMGLMLLAGVTSLPEIGVTVSSAIAGDKQLALNNLFGSIAMQVAILAVIDFAIGRKALTSVLPEPTLMLQGILNVLLLAFAGSAMVVGDILVFGVGAWSTACLFAYVGCVWIMSRSRGRSPWLPGREGVLDEDVLQQAEARAEREKEKKHEERPLRSTILRTVVAAAVILVAGYALSRSGSAIAEQTGIGASFVGFVLLAIATSLPELSSALSAARLGRYTMAISDILGTNLINVALIFLIDLTATGDPVLGEANDFAIFGALLSIVVTAVFLVGLAERQDKTAGRIGIDSAVLLTLYFGGLAILYTLR
jgi:cation:H+ antiporter